MTQLNQAGAVVARRANGYQRAVAVWRPGMGAAGAPRYEVCALPAPVHAAASAPRGAMVDEATALRVARALIAHKAATAAAGEWNGAVAEVVR